MESEPTSNASTLGVNLARAPQTAALPERLADTGNNVSDIPGASKRVKINEEGFTEVAAGDKPIAE